jgi:MFS family permease
MENDTPVGTEKKFIIRLVGVTPGASRETLIQALQRIFKGKSAEEIGKALERLPLVLSRSLPEDKAKKIKLFLESQGAILNITYSASAIMAPPKARQRPEVAPAVDTVKAVESAPPEVERRAKPRVHAGIQVQPMGIGEILDRSFRLLRQYFWLFFMIIFIPQAIFFIVNFILQLVVSGPVPQDVSGSMLMGFGISGVFAFIIFLILQFWAQGALIHAVSETYLGHSTSIKASYGAMRSRLGRLIGTMILWSILVFGALALFGILVALTVPISWILAGVVILLAVWILTSLVLNWLLTDKVVVLEEMAWMKALRRSKELMKGRTEPGFWRSMKTKASLILILGIVIWFGINLLFQLPGVLLGVVFSEGIAVTTVQGILNMVASSLATAYTAIAMILFYYDIRVRKEGFDLKMMAEKL